MDRNRVLKKFNFSLTLLLCCAFVSLASEKRFQMIDKIPDFRVEEVDANLTLFARYSTILEMQWEMYQEDVMRLCDFSVTQLPGSELSLQDCIDASSSPERSSENYFFVSEPSHPQLLGQNNDFQLYGNAYDTQNTQVTSPKIEIKARKTETSKYDEKSNLNQNGAGLRRRWTALEHQRPEDDLPIKKYYFNLTDLDPCTEYKLELAVISQNNERTYSGDSRGVSTLVDETEPPKSLQCNASEEMVNFSWDPPFDNCLPTTYLTSWTASSLWSEASQSNTSSTEETSLELNSPMAWAEYHLAVQAAYNDTLSETSEKICTTPEQKPTAVQNVAVQTSWSDIIWLTWDPPAEANGNISTYIIHIEEENKAANCSLNVSSEFTSYNITGLCVCVPYSISVGAVNGAGEGPPSDPVSHELDGSMQELELTCTLYDTNISITWYSIYRECEEVSYEIQYNSSVLWESRDTASDVIQVNSSSFAITDEDFIPGTMYNISVSTIDNLSAICSETSPEAASSAPAITKASSTTVSIYVAWTPPEQANGILSSYKVAFTDKNNVTLCENVDSSVADLNRTDEIIGCMDYTVSVAAVNSYGAGFESMIQVATVAVLDFACVENSSSEIVLSWHMTDTGDCSEKELNLSWTGASLWEDGIFFRDSIKVKGIDQNVLISDLHPYSEYIFSLADGMVPNGTLRAICQTYEDVPTPPQSLDVLEVTSSSVTLSWEEPESWNGIELGYNLTCDGQNFNVSGQKIMLVDLEEKTRYEVYLEACTAAGCSEDVRTSAVTLKNKANVTVIVLSVIAVCMFLVAGLVFALIYRNKRRASQSPPATPASRDYSLNDSSCGTVDGPVMRTSLSQNETSLKQYPSMDDLRTAPFSPESSSTGHFPPKIPRIVPPPRGNPRIVGSPYENPRIERSVPDAHRIVRFAPIIPRNEHSTHNTPRITRSPPKSSQIPHFAPNTSRKIMPSPPDNPRSEYVSNEYSPRRHSRNDSIPNFSIHK